MNTPFTSRFLFTLALVSLCGFAAVPRGWAQVGSDPTVPVVTLTAPDPTASESGDQGRFLLFRAGPTNLSLNVFWIIGGTAVSGKDYLALPAWVTIPAGRREVVVPVVPLEDSLIEGPETVNARLEYSPLDGPQTFEIGYPSNATVTISDNEPPPTNRPPVVRILTPTNGATFLSPASFVIAAHAEDPDREDYVATVEFFAGTTSLGVTTNNPLVMSPVNPFLLLWSNVPPGNYVLRAQATDSRGASALSDPVHVLVRNEPLPTLVTIRAADPAASEPGVLTVIDPGVFVVTRSGRTNEPLQVFYSIHGTASNGLDYAAIPNSVVIPAGRWAAEIVIRPLPDDEVEGVERVALKLEAPVCITIFPPPPGCYQVGVPGEAVVSIADREPPANQPPLVRILKPVEGQTLCAPTNVLIVAETKDPDGYVPKVEFFANNLKIGGADKSFFVKPPPGEPIRYEFLWTNPPPGRHTLAVRATDDQGATAWADPVTIWIVNTNTPPPPPRVTITATDPVASEGTNCWSWQGFADGPDRSGCITNTATFVVRRFGPTNEALTVHYRVAGSASNGADYSELGGEVTIPAGRRAVPIVVVPMDDTEPECTETVLLALRVPPATITAVPPYLIGDPGRAAAIIVDNDRPRPVTGMLPDRCFHFMKPGRNGTWFRIECSTDMVHWTPLGTNCVTDGALHFVDLDTDGLPTRFYRAVPEDAPPVE